MGIDCMREDRPPKYKFGSKAPSPGTWTRVSVCDNCRLYAWHLDCPISMPCPRCGNDSLRHATGYWERLSPKWMFWKNDGKWRVKPGEEAKRNGL